jgi:hypothetical protein
MMKENDFAQLKNHLASNDQIVLKIIINTRFSIKSHFKL